MKQALNINEFKALIARYESIALDEIEEATDENPITIHLAKRALTGFGSTSRCTLCQPTRSSGGYIVCSLCIYGTGGPVGRGCTGHRSYDTIDDAKEPNDLLSAYRARARYMRGVLKRYNAKIKRGL